MDIVTFLLGLGFFLFFLIFFGFIIWVLTLIHQAKRSLLGFFVITLIFGWAFGIIITIYWIVWLFERDNWNKRKKR